MKTKSYTLITKLTLIISIGLYLVSLTQECYCTTGACGDGWSGGSIVVLGAIGGIMSVAGLTWYANPVLWVAWSLINKNPKKAFYFSLGAALIAASFMLFTEISDTKAGKTAYITNYRLGYWLWLSSTIITLIGAFIIYLLRKSELNEVLYNHDVLEINQ